MAMKLGIARGAISLGGARFIVNLANAAGILVLARLLTPDDFGIVAIATAVLSVVASFTEVSLQAALVQSKDPTQDHIDTVWTMSLLRAVLIFSLFLVCAWPLSIVYDDPRLIAVFLITGLTGAFFDFYNPLISLSTRYLRFGPLTRFQISQKLLGLVLAIALAIWLRSFWAIIIGNAIGAIVASLLSYRMLPYRPRFTLSKLGEIWGFSRWLFCSQLCETLNWRFDQLAIGMVATKASLGQYAVADNLAVLPSRELTNPIRNALFAGLVSVKEQAAKLRQSYLRSQSLIAMITTPIALGLAIAAEPAVLVVLGEKWLDCVIYVRIFALTYLIEGFTTAVRPLAMAMGETRVLFIRQLLMLAVRLPLITLGLIAYGPVGAAAGRLASSLIHLVISALTAGRLLNLSFSEMMRTHVLTLCGLAIMGPVMFLTDKFAAPAVPAFPILKLGTIALLGAGVYAASIIVIWAVGGKKAGAVSDLFDIARGLPTLLIGRRSTP